jgi:hypothetical protein
VFIARAISPGQKWCQTIWEEKYHADNGKAQACTQDAFLFFVLSWSGGAVEVRQIFFIFPWFPMYSHYVPFKFSMGSHQVPKMFLKFPMHSHCVLFKFSMGSHQIPNMFPKFPMCSPTQHVLHSTSHLSHMLWQMLSSFHPYSSAKWEELHTSNYNLIFWGSLHTFISFE